MSSLSSKRTWTTSDIPNQIGKIALVTGATAGLGFETALVLAKAGATVIVGGRNEEKGKAILERILDLCPDAKIDFGKVDQCSLTSVKEFGAKLSAKYAQLDILINNAGIVNQTREVTKDGFEMTFETNHLSHFALTAHLLPLLRKSSSPRVVNVSSILSRRGKIDFDDLQSEKGKYVGLDVYGHTKLANLLFTFELQRKSDAGGWGITSIVAHPGYSRTDMNASGKQGRGVFQWLGDHLIRPILSQSATDGALPQIFAATSPEAKGSGYYGPNGFYELKGTVAPAHISPAALDEAVAVKLWDVSTKLAAVTWP